MQQFYLNPVELYEVLREKGITHLHHANTVLTSLTFIKENALLSRSYAEKHGLQQTPQDSDDIDKKYDVWDSVFLDGLDLHDRFDRANLYGPVLFKVKIELLLAPFITSVVVTKTNPIYFGKFASDQDRYYSSIKDIKSDYRTGKVLDSRIMFTIRNPEKNISLDTFLSEIILDRPSLKVTIAGETKNLGIEVHKAIYYKLQESGLGNIPIRLRHANQEVTFCSCIADYNLLYYNKIDELRKRFKFAE